MQSEIRYSSLSRTLNFMTAAAAVRQLHNGAVPVASWILVGVLGCVLVLSIVACLVVAKRMPSDVGTHVCRCGGCGRRFRVPSAIPADAFMCRDCIREGRRRQSIVQEEEREERLQDMNDAPKNGMTLHRVSSHFYRMKTKVFGGVPAAGDDGVQDDIESGRRGLPDDAQRPTINIHRGFTKAVDAGQIQIPDANLCEICFDDEARVVLLPCGHGGLCEGCAKDIISATGNCYLCRQPVKLVAIVGRKEPSKQRTTSTASRLGREISDLSTDNYFAQVVGPDQLHHLESRVVDDRQRSVSASAHQEGAQLGTPAVAQPQGISSVVEGSAPSAGEGPTTGLDVGEALEAHTRPEQQQPDRSP